MSSLEARVHRLEQLNRRLVRILASVGLLLAASVVLAARRSPSIEPLVRANRIQVVDARGELFVDIRAEEAGGLVETYAGAGPTAFVGGDKSEGGVTTGLIQAFAPRGNVAVELTAEASGENPAGPFNGRVSTFGADEEALVALSQGDAGYGSVEVACGNNCWQALPLP